MKTIKIAMMALLFAAGASFAVHAEAGDGKRCKWSEAYNKAEGKKKCSWKDAKACDPANCKKEDCEKHAYLKDASLSDFYDI